MGSIFTRERIALYCTALLISAVIAQVFSVIRDKRIGGDFAVFYAEGRLALKYPHSQLYNVELQDKEYAKVVGAKISSPFPYTPWFTVPLAFLAQLPYLFALAIWTLMSVSFLIAGYWLTARAVNVSASWDLLGFLVCLSFPPYLFYTLLNGQPSSFAFLALSSAYSLQKNKRLVLAGIVLSLLTYKPTLLLFVGPMLLVTLQWKILAGLTFGGATLALVSLGWAGVEGCVGFFKLLGLYSQVINSPVEVFQTEKYIDTGAALRLLIGPQPTLRFVLLSFAFPVLCFFWHKIGFQPLSWALAVVCGLLFNAYSPIYDCTLLIFALMLVGIDTLHTWLICAIYLVSAVTVYVASVTGIQLYTLVLIFLLSVLMRRAVNRLKAANGLSNVRL